MLTNAVDAGHGRALGDRAMPLGERQLEELRNEIACRAHTLAEEIAREALQALEAPLLERLSARLRQELPGLIDAVLRDRPGGTL